MDGGGYNPSWTEELFKDYRGRRAGIIKALTHDYEKFYTMCDPEKENLCLYGFPNENWEVDLPDVRLPPELPQPALGINFARERMNEKDWLSFVAVNSDAWLLAVAFYLGEHFGFDKEARNLLFEMINGLPTVFEVVSEAAARKEAKERTLNSSSSKNKKLSSSHLASVRRSLQKCVSMGAVLVAVMSFGYAVICVKDGSMESVWGSLLTGLKT